MNYAELSLGFAAILVPVFLVGSTLPSFLSAPTLREKSIWIAVQIALYVIALMNLWTAGLFGLAALESGPLGSLPNVILSLVIVFSLAATTWLLSIPATISGEKAFIYVYRKAVEESSDDGNQENGEVDKG